LDTASKHFDVGHLSHGFGHFHNLGVFSWLALHESKGPSQKKSSKKPILQGHGSAHTYLDCLHTFA